MNITFREITASHPHYCRHFWRLYTHSFPPEERRTMSQQLQLDYQHHYHLLQIFSQDIPIGFITYWDFPFCIFFEHFAIAPEARGGGIGTAVLEALKIHFVRRTFLLEVEPPTEELQQRRIKFYQKSGFYLLPYPYVQPPYQKEYPPQPMCLMSYPYPLSKEEMDNFVKNCHPLVYPQE